MKPGPRTAAAGLAAAVVFTHLPLFRAGYVQDDHVAIEGSRVVAEGDAAAILGASYWEGAKGGDRTLYRPVTVATYALERAAAGGGRAALSHAINLALHAAVCWLIFSLAARAGVEPGAALACALLFAVTPSKSEAVANVVGRAEILAAAFTLAAVRLALERRRAAAWVAGGCVLLAACSKETGAVALPLVGLAAATLAPRRALDLLGTILPSVLAFEVFVILRTRALGAFFLPQTVPYVDNPLAVEHGVRYAATALALIPRYARTVLYPFGLANDYSCASIPIEPSLWGALPLAGLALIAGAVAIASRGRIALLFSGVAVLPYLLVGNLLVPVGAIFAERFLYLPLAGGCLLLALAVARLGDRARVATLVLAAILGVGMFARARQWKDDATIFAATARHNPRSPRAWLWLGKPEEAVRCCPEFAGGWQDLGVAQARSGDLSGAGASLREAIRIEPARASLHLNLGIVLRRAGDLPGAVRELRKATVLDPENAKAFAELGHVRTDLHDSAGAREAYRRAIALGRTDLRSRLE